MPKVLYLLCVLGVLCGLNGIILLFFGLQGKSETSTLRP